MTAAHRRRATVLVIAGDLDLVTLPDLTAALDEALAAVPEVLTIDAHGVGFAGSSAINALVRARATALAQGTELRLGPVSASLDRVLAITRLDQVFDIAA